MHTINNFSKKIIVIDSAQFSSYEMAKLVKSHLDYDLHINHLEDLGLQLLQLLAGFRELKKHHKILSIKHKPYGMTDELDFDLINHLAEMDHKLVAQRTSLGLKKHRNTMYD